MTKLMHIAKKILNKYFPEVRPEHLYQLIVTGGCSAATLAIGFIVNVIWARFFPPETFGSFRLLLNAVNIGTALSLVGVGTAVMMSAANKNYGNIKILFWQRLAANMLLSLVTLTGYQIFAQHQLFTEVPEAAIIITALLFPLYNLTDIWTNWLNGSLQFNRLAFGRITKALLGLFAISLFAMIEQPALFQIALMFFGLMSLQNIIYLYSLIKQTKNLRTDKKTISFNKHLSLAGGFAALTSLDVILLGLYFPMRVVAIYAVCLIFPEAIKALNAVINQVAAPRTFLQMSPNVFWRKYKNIIFAFFFFWLAMGLIGFVYLPDFIELAFTRKYYEAGNYAKYLWLATCIVATSSMLSMYVIGQKKTSYVYLQQIGYPVILLIGYFLLVSNEVAGLIAARIIGSAFLFLLNIFYFTSLWNRNSRQT